MEQSEECSEKLEEQRGKRFVGSQAANAILRALS